MVNKLLTWDDLAVFYHKKTGGRAKIMPMETIYNWAIKQEEIVETKDGIYFKEDKHGKEKEERRSYNRTAKERQESCK